MKHEVSSDSYLVSQPLYCQVSSLQKRLWYKPQWAVVTNMSHNSACWKKYCLWQSRFEKLEECGPEGPLKVKRIKRLGPFQEKILWSIDMQCTYLLPDQDRLDTRKYKSANHRDRMCNLHSESREKDQKSLNVLNKEGIDSIRIQAKKRYNNANYFFSVKKKTAR